MTIIWSIMNIDWKNESKWSLFTYKYYKIFCYLQCTVLIHAVNKREIFCSFIFIFFYYLLFYFLLFYLFICLFINLFSFFVCFFLWFPFFYLSSIKCELFYSLFSPLVFFFNNKRSLLPDLFEKMQKVYSLICTTLSLFEM